MIELANVSKRFKMGSEYVTALQDVSIEIQEGEFVALVGPSGSGKTTLLNLIGGLEYPSEGHIKINGKDIARLKDSLISKFRAEHLGFVFQTFNLLPRFSVLKNVMLASLLAGVPAKKAKVKALELLESVGLANKVKYLPGKLSGGERQRVAIARALMNDPDILVADEPTGNLDEKNAANVMELLMDLSKKRGKTLILVTHNPELAKLADRVINLKNGQVQKEQK